MERRSLLDPSDRKILYLICAALVLLGAATGYELAVWRSRDLPRPGASAPGRPPFLPPQEEARTRAPAQAVDSLELLRARRAPTLTLEELLGALATVRARPAAREFAEDFLRDKQLRRGWEAFKRKGDADELVAALSRSRNFPQLLAKYARDPRFVAVAKELDEHTPLAAWLSESAARISERRSRGRGAGAGGSNPSAAGTPRTAAAGRSGRSVAEGDVHSAPMEPAPIARSSSLEGRREAEGARRSPGTEPSGARSPDERTAELAPIPAVGAAEPVDPLGGPRSRGDDERGHQDGDGGPARGSSPAAPSETAPSEEPGPHIDDDDDWKVFCLVLPLKGC